MVQMITERTFRNEGPENSDEKNQKEGRRKKW